MERVHIQLLTGLPASAYARLRDAQRQAGAVWNVCCERHRQARISGERWPRRRELQQATKGDQFALHSQSVQMVVHAFLANVDTTRQLRAEGDRHMRYPYKTKRYYPVHWPRQAMAVYAHKIVLPMGRGRESIVLARPGGLPDDGAACKLVWNGAGYELHWSIGEPDTPLKRAGTRATADLGQIHQVALTVETGEALVVSGRGIRSEKRRLSKTHGRLARVQSRCKKGSRRWWKLQSARNRQAARSRRRIRDLRHKGVRAAVDFCEAQGVNRLYIGNPQGVRSRDCGRHHNQRMSQWEYGKDLDYFEDKSQKAGIECFNGTERGTSSHCPECGHRHKPRGREWRCKKCGFSGHRDVVGGVNMHPIAYGNRIAFPHRITYLRPGRDNAFRQAAGMNNPSLGSSSGPDTGQSHGTVAAARSHAQPPGSPGSREGQGKRSAQRSEAHPL